ncbi:type II toxin-antitoxin system RelE/ParE family toxin [Massilia genomosp. 1]|uniref:Type II toxin-antitoxin system RelE/ParE family toxin n=1 Tax=Massilia genomosp. 1 TaxID=2609280 RepID=A0ABX0MTB1_9BURK|nr:type II toxin-antitoxin system RelE/ParE family toxin [Massilia genomosp. 1]NHZ63258.1 type II toxin-antitoxin system RelE/ParE family toxin [Massilia genomosp. 1]
MPQVRFSRRALIDLKRLREFLRPQSQAAAKRATEAIVNAIGVLKQHPGIGRPISDMPDGYHELLISFGNTGYIARYRYSKDEVTILSVSHQKEAPP